MVGFLNSDINLKLSNYLPHLLQVFSECILCKYQYFSKKILFFGFFSKISISSIVNGRGSFSASNYRGRTFFDILNFIQKNRPCIYLLTIFIHILGKIVKIPKKSKKNHQKKILRLQIAPTFFRRHFLVDLKIKFQIFFGFLSIFILVDLKNFAKIEIFFSNLLECIETLFFFVRTFWVIFWGKWAT